MAQPITDSAAAERGKGQYGLRGLLILLFSAALGLSALAPDRSNPGDCLLIALMVWAILGLAHQVRDLWSSYHGRSDLAAEQRWGWRFAATWRAAVAAILAGGCVAEVLLSRRLLVLPEREGDFLARSAFFPHAVLWLALLTVLESVPRRITERRPSWWSAALTMLGWPAAGLLCLLIWTNQTAIHYLVYLAVSGIENAQPLHLAPEGIELNIGARGSRFLVWTVSAAGVGVGNLLLVRELARRWARGPRTRWLLGGLLTLGLAASAAYLIWVAAVGARSVSPAMAETLTVGPPYRWYLAFVLVIFLVTAGAYRRAQLPAQPAPKPELRWRRRPRSYYHERPPLIGLVIVAQATQAGIGLHQLSRAAAGTIFTAFDLFSVLLSDPGFYLQVALLLATLGSLWASWRMPAEVLAAAPPALPPGRFSATWLGLLLTALFGIPAIAALSFALWLSPWYRLP